MYSYSCSVFVYKHALRGSASLQEALAFPWLNSVMRECLTKGRGIKMTVTVGELDLQGCLTRSNQKEGCQTAGCSLNRYMAMGEEI